MTVPHFSAQNGPIVLNEFFFFEKTINKTMIMLHLWAQNGAFAPKKNLIVKAINIIFMYLLAPFIPDNF